MKRLITNILCLLWAALVLFHAESFAANQTPANSGKTENQDYIIGHGDILNIHIWKDDALTRRVTVLPDGRIAFPLIGEIVAGGKTVAFELPENP